MAQYLTYDEYVGYGGTASQTAFPTLEFTARKQIDYMTFNRVQAMAEIPEAVKLCMTTLINMGAVVGIEAQALKPQATGFNTDGYSETYGNAYTADEATKQMGKQIAAMLYGEVDDNGVPLLYRGVRG